MINAFLFILMYQRPQAAFFAEQRPSETEEKLLQRILNADIADIAPIDGALYMQKKRFLKAERAKYRFIRTTARQA